MSGMDLDGFLSHGRVDRKRRGGKLAARVNVPKLVAALGIDAREPRGSEMWAPCPFHGETEPSFQIKHAPGEPENGLWRCFGCKAHGNAIGLVRDLRGVDWAEARALLDDIGALAKPPPLPTTITIEVIGRRGFRIPMGVKFAPLNQWTTPPRRYVEGRGITPEQVVRWSIGYSFEGRLRGRIVIPFLDRFGKPRGYCARSFAGAEKRYLEPKRAENANPAAIFGERHWPEPGDRNLCIVTEGAINGLAVERAAELIDLDASFGAVHGSNLLPGHISRLSTFDRLLVASDPDHAGDFLYQALVDAIGRWKHVDRVTIPNGKDCDDLAPSNLAQRIYDAESLHRTRSPSPQGSRQVG